MEDAHVAIPDFDVEKGLSLFGVFDGHGGVASVEPLVRYMILLQIFPSPHAWLFGCQLCSCKVLLSHVWCLHSSMGKAETQAIRKRRQLAGHQSIY